MSGIRPYPTPQLSQMSLAQKVGQLMIFGFHGRTPSEQIKDLIINNYVGGIILFSRNIGKTDEVLKLNTDLQRVAREGEHPFPLFISIDQENGIVRRLGKGTTIFPGNMALAALPSDEEEAVYKVSRATALELKALGINMNLAPVVDVNNNPDNPVIGVRSFGENPLDVSRLGKAHIFGHHDAGIITVAKHFPGHGDTELDSHLYMPVIPYGKERLERIELIPFHGAMEAETDAIMISHVHFSSLEPNSSVPATLSYRVVNDLLRKEMGYEGVVISDCMEMRAITDQMTPAQGVLKALKAGVDMFILSHSYDMQKQTIKEVLDAAQKGDISENLINQACQRVFRLKRKYLSWPKTEQSKSLRVSAKVGCKEHRHLATKVMQNAVTLVKNENQILPLSFDTNNRLLVLYPKMSAFTWVEDRNQQENYLGNGIKEVFPHTLSLFYSNEPDIEEIKGLVRQGESSRIVIVATSNAVHTEGQVKLVKRLMEIKGDSLIVVAVRNPYDITAFPEVKAYLTTYEYTPLALEAAAQIITGKVEAKGKLPVTIPGLYERGHRW